jgi:hypothetical protein
MFATSNRRCVTVVVPEAEKVQVAFLNCAVVASMLMLALDLIPD